jgi:Family of unknown function (DUF6399)
MCNGHSTPCAPATEDSFRYARSETVRHLHDRLHPDHSNRSGRDFARQAGVPHTTLRYWQQRQQRTDASSAVVAFFESPAGLAFLKQLLLAAHLVFQQLGVAGLRPLCHFLVLAQLAPFVAASYGTHQQLAALLHQLLDQYDQEQRQQLGAGMAAKTVTLCEDENFHGPQPCLVAIEPISNFLVLETYRPHRDAVTWNTAVQTALQGLPVTVVQVTSDLAQGLQAHARDGLGAHHSPDLMHVQADLHKATSLPFRRHLETAEEKLKQSQEVLQVWVERYRLHRAGIRSPGPAPDFQTRMQWVQQAVQYWQQQVSQRQQGQEQLHEAVRGIGDDYHPFDSQTGQALSAEQLQQRLEQRFATIERLAEEAELSGPCRARIAKARRVLPRLVATLAWFWHSVRLLVESLELSVDRERVVYERLLPGLYWQGAAERGRTAADKIRLRELAQGLLAGAWSAESSLTTLGKDEREMVRRACQEGANRFVRSSSCVEGRNGQLSLQHHGCHVLSPGKLRALTVLHNYFVQRADGTTAAERFYGKRPADLFKWLLQRFPDPPRPAKQGRNPYQMAS